MLTYTTVNLKEIQTSTLQETSRETARSASTFEMDYWSLRQRTSTQMYWKEAITECVSRRDYLAKITPFIFLIWNAIFCPLAYEDVAKGDCEAM